MKNKLLNIASYVMLYALASLVTPALPGIGPLYYIILTIITVYTLFLRQKTWDVRMILLLVACALSVILNDPPAFFKSWGRLGLFLLMLVVASPLCQSKHIEAFRLKLFSGIMWLIVAISGLSCLAYFAGVDLTVRPKGATDLYFGGLTGNSMLLAVCAGISFLFILNKLLNKEYSDKHKKKYIIVGILLLLASFLCLLLSGSRGAALSTVISVLFLLYKQNQKKLFRFFVYIALFTAFSVVTYPVWELYTKALVEKQKGNDISGSATASRDSKWEARVEEFKSSPVFGIGFSAVDLKYTDDYMIKGGIVETGTSWGGMLSMIGILGIVPFLCLHLSLLWFLFRDITSLYYSGLFAVVICWFSVHMVVEGYILAGGSFLCFMVWLTIGAASAYRTRAKKLRKEVRNEIAV